MYTWNKNAFSLIFQSFLSLILNNISIHYTFREHNGLFFINYSITYYNVSRLQMGKKGENAQTAKNTLTAEEPVNGPLGCL